MGSKKQKKKKKAAAMARKNVNVTKNVKTQEKPDSLETADSKTEAVSESVPELKEGQEYKQGQSEKESEVVSKQPDSAEKDRGLSSIGSWFKRLKGNAGRGWYASLAICGILLIAVVFLTVRMTGLSKELESVQAMSVNLQKELDNTKKEWDEAELELLSVGRELADATAKPTATPEPVVTPETELTPEPLRYVVCVDPGHGDWDGGATVVNEDYRVVRAEKDDNLWMSKLFRDALMEYENVEVIMTREDDTFLELPERTDIANEKEADVLISFHRNAYEGNNEVSGIEFWIHSSRPKDAEQLAGRMLSAVVQVGGMKNRGVKYGSMSDYKVDYSINRRASRTSMIIELGFITSEQDNEAYDTNGEAYAKEMAKVVYDWLVEKKKDN